MLLLVVVAVLGVRLDRRLRALRDGGDGVRAALTELTAAIARAEAAIAALQAARSAAPPPVAPPVSGGAPDMPTSQAWRRSVRTPAASALVRDRRR